MQRVVIDEAEENEWGRGQGEACYRDPAGPNLVGEIAHEGTGERGDGEAEEYQAGFEGVPAEGFFDVEGEDAVEGGEDGDVDEDAVDGGEKAGHAEEDEDCGYAGFLWGGLCSSVFQ